MNNEFTDWFDEHDDELLVMECEDIAREAFYAGMKAAQQSVQADLPSAPAGCRCFVSIESYNACPVHGTASR